eukprot:m.21306 g.21306  ORF g.21306 m.21306 type:complete len:128 (-) comp8272_c0_seq1:115-498(-)
MGSSTGNNSSSGHGRSQSRHSPRSKPNEKLPFGLKVGGDAQSLTIQKKLPFGVVVGPEDAKEKQGTASETAVIHKKYGSNELLLTDVYPVGTRVSIKGETFNGQAKLVAVLDTVDQANQQDESSVEK